MPHAILAVVTGQVQHQTALRLAVPSRRIIEFPDQDAAAEAVRGGQADASASTALGNHAYVQAAADSALVAITDRPVTPRGPVALGAHAFNRSATDLISAVNRALESYLGSPDHLALMARHGFLAEQLEPIFR